MLRSNRHRYRSLPDRKAEVAAEAAAATVRADIRQFKSKTEPELQVAVRTIALRRMHNNPPNGGSIKPFVLVPRAH